jgi:hypothetical protein
MHAFAEQYSLRHWKASQGPASSGNPSRLCCCSPDALAWLEEVAFPPPLEATAWSEAAQKPGRI